MTTSAEYADRPPLEDETPETAAVLNEAWAKWRRLKPLVEHLSELQELAWESDIVLGSVASTEVCKVARLLREKYAHLSSSIQAYFDLRHDQAEGRDISNQWDFMTELRHDVYGLTKDKFYEEIETSVAELAALLGRWCS